jgi:OOP family OmpA-OmpF porin
MKPTSLKSISGFSVPAGLAAVSAAVLLGLGMSPAWAQSSSSSSDMRYSWLPYTTSGYVGGSLGTGELHTDCVPGLSCDDPKTSGKIYTGGMFNPYLGVELGYVQWGDADRNGGTTKVRGVNAMLTGFLPLGPMFTLVGKVGTTYGWSKVSLGTGVDAPSGSVNGFGLAYGGGLSFDFDRNWSATLDWERHQLKFEGSDRKDVDLTTLGIKYRFCPASSSSRQL